MKVNRTYNRVAKPIAEFHRGEVFIDPSNDDVMMITDMPTGDEHTCLAVSLYWGTMQEYTDNEMMWECKAEVNVDMD